MADSDVDMEAGPSVASKPQMTYDPEQDPEVRREIRRNYRGIAKEIEGIALLSRLSARVTSAV